LLLRPASEEDWTQLRADIGRLLARRVPAGADVEDVTQDVLLRVWRHGDSLREEERFGAWLSRIAHTAAAEHLRARQRHPLARFAESEGIDPGVPEDAPAKDLIAAVLRPFIARLPETYRQAVVLSELDGLPHAAVAARLGLSISGVKSRVQRGRAQLRAMLEECCEIALDARGTPVSCRLRVRGPHSHAACTGCC
jgi:RNA polymerase sigma-70 factor (ECF subfamily)